MGRSTGWTSSWSGSWASGTAGAGPAGPRCRPGAIRHCDSSRPASSTSANTRSHGNGGHMHTPRETLMTRRLLLPLVLVLALGACRDAIAPTDDVIGGGAQFDVLAAPTSPVHVLRQAPGAPPLETYRVSFWARQNKESIVAVNYRPAAGQSVGDPVLRLR